MSHIADDGLTEVVETVWLTVLELPIEQNDSVEWAKVDSLIAEIGISGAWTGTVLLEASMDFLVHAASLMFCIAQSEVERNDCVDTLTELTNMLGGTVKCLLPEVCDLALPTIKAGEPLVDEQVQWMNFNCQGHPFAVSVSPSVDGGQVETAA